MSLICAPGADYPAPIDGKLVLHRRELSRVAELVSELRRGVSAAVDALGSADGRWTVASTTLAAVVVGSVAWLALDATPPGAAAAYAAQRTQAPLPYDLLARLTGARALPGIAAENYRAASLLPTPGPVGAMADEAEAKPSTETKMLRVESGDTIMGMLQEAGVDQDDAVAVVNAMKPIYSPRSIKPGQVFEASFGKPESAAKPTTLVQQAAADSQADASPLRLLSLSFSPSIEHQITVQLTAPDEYSAQDVQKKLEARYQHAGATIDSNLYLAATQAGIPANIVVELIRMFSYDVDFQRDVHSGDSFEVFFNRYYTPEGQAAKARDILAATMTLGGKAHTLYRFEGADGVEYFDATGQSAKSMLMKTPVDGARISSTFGMRFHPVLGYSRMHKGVDFAVPVGTPVMAAGTGTVTYEGPAAGYGNFLVIDHGNGYATAYGHLSRFAGGLRRGARVHQGDIVAFSGNTGITTGPHLHYEIRMNGDQLNPAKVKIANGRKLDGKDLKTFLAERARIETLVASLPIEHQVADAAGTLRPTSQR